MAAIIKRSGLSPSGEGVFTGNWASRERGVIVVFCLVFIVAVGLISMYVYKWLQRRKATKSVV